MIAYTDGSASKNGFENSYGGFGVVIVNGIQDRVEETVYRKTSSYTTNNREEMKAILCAIYIALKKGIRSPEKLFIYSDSALAINTFSDWKNIWKNNGWKKADKKIPKNLDIVQAYDKIENYCPFEIEFIHVKGHQGNKYNELADKIAKGEM